MFGLPRKALGIDMGSSNTTVVLHKRDDVIVEPTYVAYATDRENTSKSVHVGYAAKAMYGKNPASIRVVRPFRNGAIANFESASDLIKNLVVQVRRSYGLPHARFDVFACIPEATTNVEKRAIKQSLLSAGVSNVLLLRKPIVAAIGAGVDVQRPVGSMVVDIGGGTCEISIVSLTDLIVSRSIRVGGERIDLEIINFLKRQHGILIGDRTAEELKDSVSIALPADPLEHYVSIRGRSTVTGIPIEIQINSADLVQAVIPIIDIISDSIREVIDKAPPDVMADVMEHGIILTGGVARLNGLADALAARTGLGVSVAEDPSHVIARGMLTVLQNKRRYKHLFLDAD